MFSRVCALPSPTSAKSFLPLFGWFPGPEGSHGSANLNSVLPVPVEDQKPRNRANRKRLPQLLHNPLARQMLGDVAVLDAPPVMSGHEEAVQHAKPDGGNRDMESSILQDCNFPIDCSRSAPIPQPRGLPLRKSFARRCESLFTRIFHGSNKPHLSEA